ncbi:MAG: MFS transporter [Candidatus Rickettsia vulgarisii]
MELIEYQLRRCEKQAMGLLFLGTFLEYFDLMLYVHMAVLLNDLFFKPTANQFSASLLSAFSFCMTFAFRPIGALLIGRLGDSIGRKSTVVITSFAMASCCVLMANLPTYEQIGITAAWAVTICRIIQGISSMGEAIGAEIYLTETIMPPKVYPIAGLVCVFASLGGVIALAVANISVTTGFNWRIAFWFGAIISVVGMVARTALRETPEFANAKKRLANVWKSHDFDPRGMAEISINKKVMKERINKKTAIALFFVQLTTPIAFYFVFVHCSNILKTKFGFTAAEVIHQNLIVTIGDLICLLPIIYLTCIIYPLKILRVKYYIAFLLVLACPFLLDNATSYFHILLIQLLVFILVPLDNPGAPIFYKAFPVFKRFTAVAFSFALSRAIMHVISSFGLVYLVEYFGNQGIWFLFVPVMIAYGFSLSYFFNFKKEEGLAKCIEDSKIPNLQTIL